jgi:hypothetical protein|uniref:Uncharacterized protein n=1 Tax=Zea mays TaxID=4577 RepID=A0A804NR95_MAIZE
MGKFVVRQLAKLGNQITIASTMVGLVECKVYAYKVGLDVIKLLERMQIRQEVDLRFFFICFFFRQTRLISCILN